MIEKINLTMLTDFYEITMANGYFEADMKDDIAYFDMFFRKVPDDGGYALMAGLEQVIVTCELDKVLYTSLRILTKRAWMKTWSVFCGWPGRLKNRWTGRIQMDPAVECCVSSY